MIELRTEEVEREVEDDMFTFDYNYYIYMQGFPENLDEVRKLLSKDELQLKRNG